MLTVALFCQVKCHHYWPSEGSRLYGVILVELIEENSFADYITRKFKLTHTEVQKFQKIDFLSQLIYIGKSVIDFEIKSKLKYKQLVGE